MNLAPAAQIDRYIDTIENHTLREYAARYGVWRFRGPDSHDVPAPAIPTSGEWSTAAVTARCGEIRARIDSLLRPLENVTDARSAVENAPYILEALIDRLTLREVLRMLALICGEKSDHIATNWQDETTAKVWTRAAKNVDACARKVSV